jgi:hypothetical protein
VQGEPTPICPQPSRAVLPAPRSVLPRAALAPASRLPKTAEMAWSRHPRPAPATSPRAAHHTRELARIAPYPSPPSVMPHKHRRTELGHPTRRPCIQPDIKSVFRTANATTETRSNEKLFLGSRWFVCGSGGLHHDRCSPCSAGGYSCASTRRCMEGPSHRRLEPFRFLPRPSQISVCATFPHGRRLRGLALAVSSAYS